MEQARKNVRGKRISATTNAMATPTEPVAREEWIRVAAYYRAESRGFEAGHDLEDWYEAEAVLALASSAPPRRSRSRKPPSETRAAR